VKDSAVMSLLGIVTDPVPEKSLAGIEKLPEAFQPSGVESP
jgi:hypothetical protein